MASDAPKQIRCHHRYAFYDPDSFFSLFSLKTPFRIGRIKGYTRLLLNYRTDTYSNSLTTDMVERNLLLAAPLEKIKPIQYTKEFRLYLTDQEKKDFRYYMERRG